MELTDPVIELRHTLHRYPELSGKEFRTQEILKNFLKEHSSLQIIECEGWFYALYSCTEAKAAPVAFRADMDALPMEETIGLPYASVCPGVSHKCGHDGHSAALAGFGCLLEELKPERDVYLIFQPAEETGAGGEACSRLLIEKGIAEVYACHNWSGFPKGQILVKSGISQCASQGLCLTFTGIPSHASQPEDGKNPSRAIAETALRVKELTESLSAGDHAPLLLATVVGMEAGGKNYGMSASSGYLALTLRSEDEEKLQHLVRLIKETALQRAKQDGLTVSFEDADVFPGTVCSGAGAEKVLSAAEALGFSHAVLEKPFRASEDFGWYLKKCPGAIFYVGNGEDCPQIHTNAYDFPDEDLEVIMKMFGQLCLM